jgi:hypothetical protein
MRRMAALLGTAAVVLMATSVYAQAPNFAGTWTLDQEKTTASNPAPAGGGGGGRMGGGGGGGRMGGPMTITQDAAKLAISRTMGENVVVTTYNLDGKPSTNAGGRGGEVTSTAKWDGAKLVVTNSNGQTVTFHMDGAWLVQTTTQPGREGGPATTRASYYKK